MKTAISLPDGLFARVDAAAAQRGLSRSAFLAAAAERYLDVLASEGLTERIDDVIARAGDPRDEVVIAATHERLATDDSW